MSEIRANTISAANGTGPVTLTKQHAAKAWARWDNSDNDGSGTTTPGDSFGVSSLDDDNTGSNIINLTNAMTNTNYAVTALAQFQDGNGQTVAEGPSGVTTSSYRIRTRSTSNVVADSDFVSTALFGDLA